MIIKYNNIMEKIKLNLKSANNAHELFSISEEKAIELQDRIIKRIENISGDLKVREGVYLMLDYISEISENVQELGYMVYHLGRVIGANIQ